MERQILMLMFLSVSLVILPAKTAVPNTGKWKLLNRNIGISAMHLALLPNDKIITFDRSGFGPSNLTLPEGKCQKDPLTTDCYAHSVEFDPVTRAVRPLTILTDTWCSSGALSADGGLVQTGGFRTGEKVVRYFKPCLDCDWREEPDGLIVPRWYASNQVLPDGRIAVVGGIFQFSYEFVPKRTESDSVLYQLPFLNHTLHSPEIPNNLYPFLHLSPDGNLFIFANDRAILLDYVNHKVVREYPVIPGGVSRNYPSTGSSVLLPLVLSDGNTENPVAEILVCGGTEPESFAKSNRGIFVPASKSCGRLVINSKSPKWKMEEMPVGRIMGDMIMLPTGDVLIVNGAASGSAGWGVARNPIQNPVLYQTGLTEGKLDSSAKMMLLTASIVPRLYHSTAHLLSDGRVLVGGSNPNMNYNFTAMYPTELSLEAFYPPYLTARKGSRPKIRTTNPSKLSLRHKQRFSVDFGMKFFDGNNNHKKIVYVTMVAPSFTTHSFAMNQRLLVLDCGRAEKKKADVDGYVVKCFAPATAAIAPPGYYQLFVVHDGIPSRAVWVHIK